MGLIEPWSADVMGGVSIGGRLPAPCRCAACGPGNWPLPPGCWRHGCGGGVKAGDLAGDPA
jgi:hypothetical protein